MSIRLIRCLLYVTFSALLPLRGALAESPPTTEKSPATEIRVYNVSDLTHQIANYRAHAEADVKEAPGDDGLFGQVAPLPKSLGERQETLLKTIEDLIAPESWRETGGTVGSISFVNGALVISQTPANQQRVQTMLEDLRRESDLDTMIEVNLRWLQLTPEQLNAVQPSAAGAAATNGPRPVLLDALKDETSVFCRARTLGFNGQTLTLKSGRTTNAVKSATPVVGAGAALYDIQMEQEQCGVTVQVTPRLSQDRRSIVVDVQSVVTQGETPGTRDKSPLPAPQSDAPLRVPSTQPSDKGVAEATEALMKIIDHRSRVEQSYNTTVRLADGAPVLVGGMTLEPGIQGSRQLYLVISANAIGSPVKTGK